MKTLIAFGLALVFAGVALAGALPSANSGTISAYVPSSFGASSAQPSYQGPVAFHTTGTSKLKNPRLWVACYQNGALVYGEGCSPSTIFTVGRGAGRERAVGAMAVERRASRLRALDCILLRPTDRALPRGEARYPTRRRAAEGRSVELRSQQLLRKLHPCLIERRPLAAVGLGRDGAPEAAHKLAERVDQPRARCGAVDAQIPDRSRNA